LSFLDYLADHASEPGYACEEASPTTISHMDDGIFCKRWLTRPIINLTVSK
jgi:hypothetical protein